jgi:6-phosphofructokinase 1
MSQVESRTHGVMAAFRNGSFISTDIPSKNLPARRVNPADYNTDRYRANFEHVTGPYLPQE